VEFHQIGEVVGYFEEIRLVGIEMFAAVFKMETKLSLLSNGEFKKKKGLINESRCEENRDQSALEKLNFGGVVS